MNDEGFIAVLHVTILHRLNKGRWVYSSFRIQEAFHRTCFSYRAEIIDCLAPSTLLQVRTMHCKLVLSLWRARALSLYGGSITHCDSIWTWHIITRNKYSLTNRLYTAVMLQQTLAVLCWCLTFCKLSCTRYCYKLFQTVIIQALFYSWRFLPPAYFR